MYKTISTVYSHFSSLALCLVDIADSVHIFLAWNSVSNTCNEMYVAGLLISCQNEMYWICIHACIETCCHCFNFILQRMCSYMWDEILIWNFLGLLLFAIYIVGKFGRKKFGEFNPFEHLERKIRWMNIQISQKAINCKY